MSNTLLGNFGERIAAEYLEEQDYMILERNYRCRLGEIDIIAEKNGEIVFVEVKTRSGDDFGRPSESINKAKMSKIRKAATIFMLTNKIGDHKIRFDVFELDINQIKGAF